MRILVVCQHFYPENFRINDVCKELNKKGHEVTVLTGLPNYPSGVVEKEYRHGRNRVQNMDGVRIVRSFLVGRGKSVIKMGINYMCFALFGTLKACSLKEQFDVVYVYQISPVTMAWPGIAAKKKKKIPLVIHCLDQWPISVTTGKVSQSGLLYKLLYYISVKTYRRADLITISSRSFKKYFENELDISAKDKGLLYLPSYAESIYADPGSVENDKFDLVFAGNIGPAQSCETIIEAANILKDNDDLVFHLVGDGLNRSNCEKLVLKYGLNNVVFHGNHPVGEMREYYALADAFLITMVDNEVVNSTLPAKIQSYMLSGKPVFGAINGEVLEVVRDADCGRCVGSHDAKGLAEIIEESYKDRELLYKWGKNGLDYYKCFFEKEKCISDLENALIEVTK